VSYIKLTTLSFSVHVKLFYHIVSYEYSRYSEHSNVIGQLPSLIRTQYPSD